VKIFWKMRGVSDLHQIFGEDSDTLQHIGDPYSTRTFRVAG
jgi:hypothetical protein